MFIDINRIDIQGMTLQDKVALDNQLLVEEESYFLEETSYAIHFAREGAAIKAKGRIQTAVSLQCVNCLDNFKVAVDSTFDVMLFPAKRMETKNTPLTMDEMEYIFFEGDQIDIDRLLAEQINLFLPINPVCSPYCKGICPTCGINLNHETCQCKDKYKTNELSGFLDKIKR
ncbi:MAG: YceD family protein [Candidatus Omnitrophota bacterium]